jgi:multiple sugar transport system substrate-binding protein
MNRWLVSLAFLLACMGLAGCEPRLPQVEATPTAAPAAATKTVPRPASTATPPPTDTPPPLRTIDVSADQVRGTILHFWHPWSGVAGEVIRQQVDEFNLSNPWNIVVVPEAASSYDRLDEGTRLALATGKAVDIAAGYLYQAQAWDTIQPLVDLRPYVEDAQWGLPAAEQADFYPAFWSQEVVDGRRLGIPAQRSAQVLYYNTTWAKELGFSAPPVTPEQFSQQACSAARANRSDSGTQNDGSGGWIASNDYAALLSWIYSAGGDVLRSPEPGAGQPAYNFNTPLTKEVLTSFKSLYDLGCIWLSQESFPESDFAARRGLFATGSLMDIPYQAEAFNRAGSRDAWTVIPYPSPDLNPAAVAYGPSYFVFASAPERQLAAWLFLKWMLMPQNHARFVEAGGSFPLRKSEMSYLTGYQNRYPQWAAALALIPAARPEPALPSWSEVRWALNDAATQVFRSYFRVEQLPAMLALLDQTAADLQLGVDLNELFATATP